MAAAPEESFHMSSSDLIKKEPLDYGGFGEVYLCYHKTLGHVVLKTVYTGPQRNEASKNSLLEEGSLMTRLNHERVVKLLGVIMEDGEYSLVMELIPKGNLLVMLQQVPVPMSIKGRIILEILEGMVYLTKNHVIHKDLKPENILVDKDFHIKIADLGMATCQTWSKLTKEETRRKSRMGQTAGARGAGTLSYMAPEHLQSIHMRSTEKSDVYSFGIVVWVVLTGEEPYENARSEEQLCLCVCKGDRPDEEMISEDTPSEIIELMKRCWQQQPQQRPTFEDSYNFFLPVYMDKMEPDVERDSLGLRKLYEGPEELVEKMKSLSLPPEDAPAPLLSSERGGAVPVPVEASIEDLHYLRQEPCIETDARASPSSSSSSGVPTDLEHKLDMELRYHIKGSYVCAEQPDSANSNHHAAYGNHLPPQRLSSWDHRDHHVRQTTTPTTPVQDQHHRSSPLPSSVQSWTKAEPVQPASHDDGGGGGYCYPTSADDLYESVNTSSTSPCRGGCMPASASSPSLSQHSSQQWSFSSPYHRQQSLPVYPVPDTTAPDFTQIRSLQDSSAGKLIIQNATGVQIGHNNTLHLRSPDSLCSLSSFQSNGSASSSLKEAIHKYEDHVVTEEHLDLLRDNIGANWKRCARRLGLTDVEVDTIDQDYSRDGLPEKVHQMLERWRMKEGSVGCTVGKLCQALEGCIKISVVQKLLDTFRCT